MLPSEFVRRYGVPSVRTVVLPAGGVNFQVYITQDVNRYLLILVSDTANTSVVFGHKAVAGDVANFVIGVQSPLIFNSHEHGTMPTLDASVYLTAGGPGNLTIIEGFARPEGEKRA